MSDFLPWVFENVLDELVTEKVVDEDFECKLVVWPRVDEDDRAGLPVEASLGSNWPAKHDRRALRINLEGQGREAGEVATNGRREAETDWVGKIEAGGGGEIEAAGGLIGWCWLVVKLIFLIMDLSKIAGLFSSQG